uniref:Uncharacterized protein n=1 Tax=Anopheles albimanus TaxID=7167 RepID=A0A182FYZ4_ANOAL
MLKGKLFKVTASVKTIGERSQISSRRAGQSLAPLRR